MRIGFQTSSGQQAQGYCPLAQQPCFTIPDPTWGLLGPATHARYPALCKYHVSCLGYKRRIQVHTESQGVEEGFAATSQGDFEFIQAGTQVTGK